MLRIKDVEDSLTPERVIELLAELGSKEYIERGNYIQFKTICHNEDAEDASMKLYYYKDSKRFVCYTECGCSFNIFELFKKRYDLLGIKYNFYQDIVLKIAGGKTPQFTGDLFPKYESPYSYKNKEVKVDLNKLNPNILNAFTFYATPEWLQDGISEEAMRHYLIRYSIEENKVIIPHFDKEGYLIGLRGRALNDEDLKYGKYLPIIKGDKSYAHPLGVNLYGLNFVGGNIAKKKMAIVFESEKSCLLYDTFFGHQDNIAVAVCGSIFHRYQLDLLLEKGVERVLIAFDKEGENENKKQKYFNKLKGICNKFSSVCRMGFIYDSRNLLRLKDSPIDRGRDTFLQLYKEAIWI